MSTASTAIFDGVPCVVPNRVTSHSPDFYVSYNDVDDLIYGCATTAVVVGRQMDHFYVLSGNHEAALAGKSFAECLAYLHEHAGELNRFSEALPPLGSTIEGILAAPRPTGN